MPQMMPMNWLILFLMFSAALVLFSVMNYYIFNYPTPSVTEHHMMEPKSLLWKW